MEGGEKKSAEVAGEVSRSSFHSVVSRNENPTQSQSTGVTAVTSAPPPPPPLVGGAVSPPEKKKRGRPRKYEADGSISFTLSPMPISASAPVTESFSLTKVVPIYESGQFFVVKRGRGRPLGSVNKPKPYMNRGGWAAVSAQFTPYVISVSAGEDVSMKIISFSQRVHAAICILSAIGVISNVTLRQPDSFGGTVTYEGRFEIISLSGSFTPMENEGTKDRSGGMTISLAGADGRIVGGGVVGLLIAAGPVQVVIGSFMPHSRKDQTTSTAPGFLTSGTPAATISTSSVNKEGSSRLGHQSSTTPNPNPSAVSSHPDDNWTSPQSLQPDPRNSKSDINMSLA